MCALYKRRIRSSLPRYQGSLENLVRHSSKTVVARWHTSDSNVRRVTALLSSFSSRLQPAKTMVRLDLSVRPGLRATCCVRACQAYESTAISIASSCCPWGRRIVVTRVEMRGIWLRQTEIPRRKGPAQGMSGRETLLKKHTKNAVWYGKITWYDNNHGQHH